MRRFLNKLTRSLRGPATAPAARRRARHAPLQVEALEDRRLLTGFIGSVHQPTTIPIALIDPIQAEYAATAYETDAGGRNVQQLLGAPQGGEVAVPWVSGALMQQYANGAIYWSGNHADSAHVVYGGIGAKYDSLGDAGGLHYLSHTGSLGTTSYWVQLTPGYGLPTSDEASVPGMPGLRMQTFQDGAIYWSGDGAYTVYGAIGAEYQAAAGETDVSGFNLRQMLGAPTSDEQDVPGVPGARMNTFTGGVIYWSPDSNGAHAVIGDTAFAPAGIGSAYQGAGGATGILGLPTNDVHQDSPDTTVWQQEFQYGKILWTDQGTEVVRDTSSMTFKTGYIGFADGTPVGGSLQLTVSSNGTFGITGSFNDSGWLPESVSGVVALRAPSGRLWTEPFSGSMMGKLGSGSTVAQISIGGQDSALAQNWADFEGGVMGTTTTAGINWGTTWSLVESWAQTAWNVIQKIATAAGNSSDGGDSGSTDQTTDTSDDGSTDDGGGDFTVESFNPGLNGYPVTLDAGALGVATVSVDGVPYSAGAPFVDRLMPGAHTLTTNGSDVTAFTVNADGTVSSASGALTASGTALTVNGFAVTLDPTALGVAGLALDGMALNGTAASTVNLLPGQHTLTTNGNDVTAFTVNPDGTVSYDPSLEGALTGSGTTALAVNGYAVALDATALGMASITVDGLAHDATAPFSVNLLPGQHSLSATGNDATAFTVNADGTIGYDPSLEGALAGSGTTSLVVSGRAVTLDASALGVPSLWLDGAAYDASAPLSVNLLPGQHSLSTDGTNLIWFTVNADGTVSYDPALEGTLTGSGTTGLVWQAP